MTRLSLFSVLRRLRPLLVIGVASAAGACAETTFVVNSAKQIERAASSSQSSGDYKVGKPYTAAGRRFVPREDFSYSETGNASWYGDKFHGKSTANGETFDMNALTAAHPTLPMPSMVRVTNLENGRQIDLRINDRGPFVSGRIIDVSKQAARSLGFLNKGTAMVRVDILEAESRRLKALATGQGGSSHTASGSGSTSTRPTAHPVTPASRSTPAPSTPPRTRTLPAGDDVPVSRPIPPRDSRYQPPAETNPVSASTPRTAPRTAAPRTAEVWPALPPEREPHQGGRIQPAPAAVASASLASSPRPTQQASLPTGQGPGEGFRHIADSHPSPGGPYGAFGDSGVYSPQGPLFVQAGSFTDAANAWQVHQRLESLGQSEVVAVDISGTRFHRVRLGPLPDPGSAAMLLDQVQAAGYPEARVLTEH